jgi:predicted nucleic acid-binding protein
MKPTPDERLHRHQRAAGCDTLLTEDLQDGRRINGLTIINPFV